MKSGNVFHITSVHTVFDTRIFHKESVSLVNAGFSVTLLATGCEEQTIDGVEIRSVPRERSRIQRIIKTPWLMYRQVLKGEADICHFHDPELIGIAIMLRLRGKKIVYDVHEDYPKQILGKFWIPMVCRWPVSVLISIVEWIGSLFFTSIVAATPTIAERFPVEKTIVVQNFPKLYELTTRSDENYRDRQMNMIYVGVIAQIRGVFENILAMEKVRNKTGKLILVGNFSSKEEERNCKKMKGWERVDFQGWLNRDQVRNALATSRAGLVLLHPRVNYVDSFPVKLFEYMAAGIPVIASDFPLWRKIIDDSKCGLLVDPSQPEKIAEAIDWLFDNQEEAEKMGKNGRRAVVARFNWEQENRKLIALYNKICTDS